MTLLVSCQFQMLHRFFQLIPFLCMHAMEDYILVSAKGSFCYVKYKYYLTLKIKI